jgi:hypothetical protein
MKRNSLLIFLLLLYSALAFSQKSKQESAPLSHWSFSIYGGYSQMLNKVPFDLGSEFAHYMQRLKSGWHTGLEAGYFFNQHLGAGLSYAVYFTNASQDSLTATNGLFTLKGNVSDKMRIHNLAPLLLFRLPLLKGKLLLSAAAGPVYLKYHNVGKALTDSATFTGSSPGGLGRISLEYAFTPRLSLGFNSSYTYAFLKKFTKVTIAGEELILLDKGNYQNISRFDAALCLRWMFPRFHS